VSGSGATTSTPGIGLLTSESAIHAAFRVVSKAWSASV
jgi:hypothetical protein